MASAPTTALTTTAASPRARGRWWARRPPARTVNLALQGGGAHGAFTWGALDRLLREESLAIEGVSGASAGTMNGVVLAHGLIAGGRDGARRALAAFWRRVAEKAKLWAPLRLGSFGLPCGWSTDAFSASALDVLTRFLSPYQLNPTNLNPLREVVTEAVDFERLRASRSLKLFVAATNVHSGRAQIFRTPQLSADVVLASACVPFIFQAVTVDGDLFWDGGYTANPPLMPLVSDCRAADLLVLQVNPIPSRVNPRTAAEILSRWNQIAMNAPLLRELEALAFAREQLRGAIGWRRAHRRLRRLRLHAIEATALADLGVGSKTRTDWRFFCELRDRGYEQADRWLAQWGHELGVRSTFALA